MSKKFQKKVEDFVCEKCGKEVRGSGFTNHCPNCLWGKHVDVNPGDRLETCLGLMEPVSVGVKKGGEYVLLHRCVKCGFERKNGMVKEDNFDVVLQLARAAGDKLQK